MLVGRGCFTDVEEAKARLSRGYSRAAPLYDALASHLYVAGIRQLLPQLRVPRGAAILDVGSGTGVNLLEAARWFAPARLLCGVDIAPGMVAVAQAKAASLGVPALFSVGDAERLDYPDGTFDLVICNSVLHWFKDRAAALREMLRVLRPGGQLALICAAEPGFGEWFTLIDTLMKVLTGPNSPTCVPKFPTAAEVACLLNDSGFLIEHLANPTYIQPVAHPEEFVRLMSTVAPQWAADLPEGTLRLLEQVTATLMRLGWPHGFPSTWSAIQAIGTRVI